LAPGPTLRMRVIVVDQHGVPVFGVHVEVSAAGATLVPASGLTDVDGVFRFHLTAGATPITRTTTVVATVTMHGAATGSDQFDLTIARPPLAVPQLPHREAVSVGLGALAVAAFLSTEFGRYGAFKAI